MDKDLTKDCVIQLCGQLEQALGEGYKVEPLRRCEGGFDVTEWPGKGEEEYKQLRLGNGAIHWPWVAEDWGTQWRSCGSELAVAKYSDSKLYEEWKCEKEKARYLRRFFKRAHRNQIVFKTTNTKWSTKERLKVRDCLQQHGVIKMRKSPGAGRPDPASTPGTSGPSQRRLRRAAVLPGRELASPS